MAKMMRYGISSRDKIKINIVVIFAYILLHLFALRYYILNDGLVGLNWDWYIPNLHESLKHCFERTIFLYKDINWGWLKGTACPPQALLYLVGYLLGISGICLSKIYLLSINVLASLSFYLFMRYYLDIFIEKNIKVEYKILISFFAGLLYGFSPVIFYTTLAGSAPVRFAIVLIPLVLLYYYKLIHENKGYKLILVYFVLFELLAAISLQNTTLITIIILFYTTLSILYKNVPLKKGIRLLLYQILLYCLSIVIFTFPTLILMYQNQEIHQFISKKTKPIFWESQRAFYSFISMDIAHRLLPLSAMPFDITISVYIYIFGVLSFVLIIFTLISISRKYFDYRLKFEVVFWTFIYVFTVGFSAGKELLDNLIVYVYKLPMMVFLRTLAYYCNGIIISIIILTSLYFIVVLLYLHIDPKKKWIGILPLVFLILTFLLPWWSGDLGLKNRIDKFDGKLGLLSLDEKDVDIYKFLHKKENYPIHTLVIPSSGCIKVMVNNISYVSPNIFKNDIMTGVILIDKINKKDPMYNLSKELINTLLYGNLNKSYFFQRLGVKYILFIKNASYVGKHPLNCRLKYIKKNLDFISTYSTNATNNEEHFKKYMQVMNISIFHLKRNITHPKKITDNGKLSFKDDFTICALINVKNLTRSYSVIVGKYDFTGRYYYNLILTPKGKIAFEWNSKMIVGRNINDGDWHLICGVRKGSEGFLYVDGILEAIGKGSWKPVGINSSYLYIGQRFDGKYKFCGIVKNILAFNTSLKGEQIWLLSRYLLSKQPKMLVIKKIGEGKFVSLYEVNISNILIPKRIIYLPVSIAKDMNYITTLLKDIENIVILIKNNKNLSSIALDDYEITNIRRINIYEFDVSLIPHGKKIAIYFPYRYDDNWELEVIEGKIAKVCHYKTLENMNVWILELKEQNNFPTIKIKIKYNSYLQRYYEICLIALGLLNILLIIYYLYDCYKQ